jgi:hypothetical protein
MIENKKTPQFHSYWWGKIMTKKIAKRIVCRQILKTLLRINVLLGSTQLLLQGWLSNEVENR